MPTRVKNANYSKNTKKLRRGYEKEKKKKVLLELLLRELKILKLQENQKNWVKVAGK